MRFAEDALRMMRAVRFSSQLGFEIEDKTFQAIQNNAETISNVSKERIQVELNKILTSDNASEGINNLQKSGLLKEVMPELEETVGFEQFNPHHDKDIFNHTLAVLDNCEDAKLEKRLACLLHDVGKSKTFSKDEDGVGHFYGHEKLSGEMTEDILRNLKYDNKTIDNTKFLVENHMKRDLSMKGLKKLVGEVESERVKDLLDIQMYDTLGSINRDTSMIDSINNNKVMLETILESKAALTRKDLDIDVKVDLIDSGLMKPSREMTHVLNGLLDRVLDDPTLNNKEALLSFVDYEKEVASNIVETEDELKQKGYIYLTIEEKDENKFISRLTIEGKSLSMDEIVLDKDKAVLNENSFDINQEEADELIRALSESHVELNFEQEKDDFELTM